MTVANASIDLADFRQGAAEHLDRLTRSGEAEVLTVDGEAKGVVMSPAAYDRMADLAEQAEITAGIRRGLADVKAGRVRPAEEAIRELAVRLGLDMDIVTGVKE